MPDTNWTLISGYTPQDYTDTMVFEMSSETKKVETIMGQALVAGEENSQYIKFVIPRFWDGIDISGKTFSIEYALSGQYYGTSEAVNAEMTTDKVRFGWVVPEEACCISGKLLFVLRIESADYILKSQIVEVSVYKSINVEDVVPEPTREAWYQAFQTRVDSAISDAEAAVDTAQATLTQVEAAAQLAQAAAQNAQTSENNAETAATEAQIRYGSPLTASEAALMVDENRVYVYVGDETGYTYGHWYYYNGTEWADGGVYNGSAVNTDTTLTQSGMAADAKATGDKINSIVNSAYVTDSARGGVAHFVDGANGVPMKSVKVNIVPAQSGSGDPSPSNVRPISGWDSVKVTRNGKNLLVYPYSTSDTRIQNGITFEVHKAADGRVDYVSASGTATGWSYFNFNTWEDKRTNAKSLVGKTLKITGCPKLGNDNKVCMTFQYRRFGSQQNIGLANDFGEGSNEFTVPSDMEQWAIYIQIAPGTQVDDARFYPMLRFASDTDDSYEPYNGKDSNISLSSAGTVYGGTLDVVSGELKVTHGYIASYSGQTLPSAWISDRDVYAEGARPTTGAQVVYQLATPITYNLTPTEVKSLLGINNIWSDAGDVEVEYRADTKLYIDKRLTEVTA